MKTFLLISVLSILSFLGFSQSNNSNQIISDRELFNKENIVKVEKDSTISNNYLIDIISQEDLEKIRLDIIKNEIFLKEEKFENIKPNPENVIKIIDESDRVK